MWFIHRLPNRVSIQAEYRDSDGKLIKKPHVLSLIDLNYNGAFSFDPRSFVCDAKGKNVLALFTRKGEFYLLDHEAWMARDIQEDGKQVFTMTNMTDEIKSAKDLAKYLNISL